MTDRENIHLHTHEALVTHVTRMHAPLSLRLVVDLVSPGVTLILKLLAANTAPVLRLTEIVFGDLVTKQRFWIAELATAEVACVMASLVFRLVVIRKRLVVLVPPVETKGIKHTIM